MLNICQKTLMYIEHFCPQTVLMDSHTRIKYCMCKKMLFLGHCKKMPGYYLKLGCDRFFPHPFDFTIQHYLFIWCYIDFCILVLFIPCVCGSLVTMAWPVLRLRMEETASRYGG
jgi:hypothetical protein